jgi:branched-chain amino acid transport system permease protein
MIRALMGKAPTSRAPTSSTWSSVPRLGLGALLLVIFLVPVLTSTYFTSAVAVTTLWWGLSAASITFLSRYGGMLSLAQTGLFGVAGLVAAKLMVGFGWNGWLAALAAIGITAAVGLVFGMVASGSEGIYFLMVTLAFAEIVYYFFGAVPQFGAHEGINSIVQPKVLGDPVLHPTRSYYFALVVCVLVCVSVRYLARTAFGLALQGVRDDPARMTALGYNVRLHRTSAFVVGSTMAGAAGVLSAWNDTRMSADSLSLTVTIGVLAAAVIGGLGMLEGAWAGAFVFTVISTYAPGYTDRFETLIGAILLAILVFFPDGLVGVGTLFSRIPRLTGARRVPEPVAAEPSEGG